MRVCYGQAREMLFGLEQASARSGAFMRRIVKRVYLPMKPDFVTKMRTIVPDFILRSNARTRVADVVVVFVHFARGHDPLGPRHMTVTLEPRGARTESRLIVEPVLRICPRRRTTGNGLSSGVAVDDEGTTTT